MESDIWAWIDLETTGLDKRKSEICEVAIIMTTPLLEQFASFHAIVDSREGYWHPVSKQMHKENKLYKKMASEDAIRGDKHEKYAQLKSAIATFLNMYVPYDESGNAVRFKMAGSSVHFDRSILENTLGQDWVEQFFHHVMIDVSSIRADLRSRYGQSIFDNLKRSKSSHRAMDDIKASIDLLTYCRDLTKVSQVET